MHIMQFSHTTLIILITVLVSLAAWQVPKLWDKLIFWPPAIQRGEIHRFFTHGFMHADWAHLLFNMFTLYFFGKAIEGLYRPYAAGMGFALFYLFAIVVAIIPSYTKNRHNPNYMSLGASGGVSAVLFAFILMQPWSMLYLFAAIPVPAIVFAVVYTAYSIRADRRGGGNINHSAHLWGAGFGVIATIALKPAIVSHFFYALTHPAFLG